MLVEAPIPALTEQARQRRTEKQRLKEEQLQVSGLLSGTFKKCVSLINKYGTTPFNPHWYSHFSTEIQVSDGDIKEDPIRVSFKSDKVDQPSSGGRIIISVDGLPESLVLEGTRTGVFNATMRVSSDEKHDGYERSVTLREAQAYDALVDHIKTMLAAQERKSPVAASN